GFQLSTFATGFPYDGATGPLGIAFPSSGGVLVTDFPGNARLFPTRNDGQVAGAAPVGQNYGTGYAAGLAQAGGAIYMAQQTNGAVIQVNPNGTFNQTIVSGLPSATGIVANPVNGQLFVSTTALGGAPGVLYEVNPLTKTSTPFLNVALD